MRFIAVDDEPLALRRLVNSIKEAYPDCELVSFDKPSQLLLYAKENESDVAFLDIHMYEYTGLEVAKQLKELNPKINIIFVTGYDEYTKEAMTLHASGYILKPVTKEKVEKELSDLRYPIKKQSKIRLKVNCFGSFEVYDNDGKEVYFERQKAKELLAYLIYRKGVLCSTKELATVLFYDLDYNKNAPLYFQVVVSSLMAALKRVGAVGVIERRYGNMVLKPELIDCDWYNYKSEEYLGEFMSQFPWAKFIDGKLHHIEAKKEI